MARFLAPLAAILSVLSLEATAAPRVEGARAEALGWAAVPGWQTDDQLAAFGAFRETCRALAAGRKEAAGAAPPPRALREACRIGLRAPPGTAKAARAFFERHFTPYRITPDGRALLTGYFEPEIRGSLAPSKTFPHPLLAMPSPAPNPFPTRAEIEAGALGPKARPLVHLPDEAAAFTIHVQGSARIRLNDGTARRVAFAGRNGQPYSSIGRIMVQEGILPLEEATMDRLIAWIRANPEDGRRIMRMNRSFIFFRWADELDPRRGPRGGAGIQLTPGRSIAIDKSLWPYGLPVVLAADTAGVPGLPDRFARLTVAQDTGAAILGPVRADLFVGSGDAAGLAASRLRHPMEMIVLWPEERPASGPRGR